MMKSVLTSIACPFLFSPQFKTTISRFAFFSSSIQIQEHLDCSSPSNTQPATLTQEEVTQINLLIPRLCSSNRLKEATNLITTALLTNPSLESLKIPFFLQSLSMEPDLTQDMYFLNRIKFNPKIQSFLKPITTMCVSCYFDKGQPGRALKIVQWVSRVDFPRGCIDREFYDVSVNGFWRYGMMLEALRVLRHRIINEDSEIGDKIRVRVYRGLLREARVEEALELNKALEEYDRSDERKTKLVESLDHMIATWIE